MLLQPKKTKYKKIQKGKLSKFDYRSNKLKFGNIGLKAAKAGTISSRQIEAARIAANRYLNRQGRVFIRIFPDKPITSKPAEVRMGKGKGALDHWVAPINPGRILFEIDGVSLEQAKEALRLAAQKLPVKTKFVIRNDYNGEQ